MPEDGLATFQHYRLTINDGDRLVALAEFDAAILDQARPLLA